MSAINTGAFGLGSILGPIGGSLLEEYLDFRWAFTTVAMIVVIVAVM